MSFGPLLRRWRILRGESQLGLALAAETAARHLSFLETGRAAPSREMVLRLAAILELPLRARNELLVAAGFAPAFRDTPDLAATANAPLAEALRLILKAQHPNPAIVMNRRWDILLANRAAMRFSEFFIGRAVSAAGDPRIGNAAHLYLAPDLFRPSILEWERVAGATLLRIRREAMLDVSPGGPAALLAELMQHPGIPALGDSGTLDNPAPLLPTRLAARGVEVAYITTLTSLGTAQEVLAEELRIKTFMPADQATRDFFARIAAREVSQAAE
jgi:transcriptional regulator with XRE-family HTH domain